MWLLNPKNIKPMIDKLFFILIFTSFYFIFSNLHQEKLISGLSPCPPTHEASKKILTNFLGNKNNQQNRQEFGIKMIPEDEIILLENKTDTATCLEIQKKFPWKDSSDRLTRTYYKTDDFYFVVNYSHRPRATEGIIISGHGIVILSKEFEHLGAVLNAEED